MATGTLAAQTAVAPMTDGPRYTIAVQQGARTFAPIVVELYPDVAPLTVRNFDSLVSIGFYDGTAFHRVVPDTLIQGGDPNSRDMPEDTWGYGDPSQTEIPAEFSDLKHVPGVISMARRLDDINSATSQFFIPVIARPDLDGRFSIFGHVIAGMETVDTLAHLSINSLGHPVEKVTMTITAGVPSSVREEMISAGALHAEARPNPCAFGSAIDYVTAAAGRTVITLHDAMGRTVATLADRFEGSGGHSAILDASDLPAGLYTYRIMSGGVSIVGKLMVVR
jgi:peptidyl-prolyl cis-trans isomerase B (cyclophilin B)